MMIVQGITEKNFICAIIATLQTAIFVISILLCEGIIKSFFKKDYKVFFWTGIILVLMWASFVGE